MPENYELREKIDRIEVHQKAQKEQIVLQTAMIKEIGDFIKGTELNGNKGIRYLVEEHNQYILDRKVQDALLTEDMKRVRYFATVITVGFISTIIAFIFSKK